MTGTKKAHAYTAFLYFSGLFLLAGYFTFASVQGDFGLFRRIQIRAEISDLQAERDRLQAEVDDMKNKTHRLSDNFLDLDLLDEQARNVLGLLRPDEIVVR